MNGFDAKEDITKFISNTVIPGFVLIADKHNYDRDSFIKFAAAIISTMAEISTFEDFKLPDEESEEDDD